MPFPAQFNLSDLNGSNGFVINGIDSGDQSGYSVSSGDINGDGIDDLIIGAYRADPNGIFSGESYVVFGGSSVASSGSINLSSLNGTNGFVINGIDTFDSSGYSVSSGDINGDGVDDLIIGALSADSNGSSYSGESYVVFGGSSVASSGSIDLSSLNGTNGFVINGIDEDDFSGNSVSSGDINGDGVDDLIIGARFADPNGFNSGESYVVFGGSSVGLSGSIDLSSLNGTNGFVINGIDEEDYSGNSVSSGDINGDGVDDLIIGARFADPNGVNSGESYVVFGGSSVASGGSIDLSSLNGTNGFVINGIDEEDYSGYSVSSGDINGDGVDDLIIGALGADPNGVNSGESYVVFGGSSVASSGSIDLSSLNGTNGFVINGIDSFDLSGYSVSSGDINGDGVDDLIIGALGADPNGSSSGESYVVFGGSSVASGGSIDLSSLNGTNGFVINGIDRDDESGWSVSSGDINGDGVEDLIIGAPAEFKLSDNFINFGVGETYVVFGVRDVVDQQLRGTQSDDTIQGGQGNDTIQAGNGDDSIQGMDGNDKINGGQGNDTIEGGSGGDAIFGGAGDDLIAADLLNRFDDLGGSRSFIKGDAGNDTIFGGGKNDFIDGGSDDDVLFGKSGDDTIEGRGGDDILNGGLGNDKLRGRAGIDTADYSDLTFAGVNLDVAGLDVNLSQRRALHSSDNNALSWNDRLNTIENVNGTIRNDRFIGDGQDNVFDGKGEVNDIAFQTTFTDKNGDTYQVTGDVVEYSGNESDFTILGSTDNFTVQGSGIGTDTLIDIEFLKFDDGLVAVDDSLFFGEFT